MDALSKAFLPILSVQVLKPSAPALSIASTFTVHGSTPAFFSSSLAASPSFCARLSAVPRLVQSFSTPLAAATKRPTAVGAPIPVACLHSCRRCRRRHGRRGRVAGEDLGGRRVPDRCLQRPRELERRLRPVGGS